MKPTTIASLLVRGCILVATIGPAGAEDPEPGASAMRAVLTSSMPQATAQAAITRISLSRAELPVVVTAAAAAPRLAGAADELPAYKAHAPSRPMARDIATLKAAHAAMREGDAVRAPRLAAMR